MPAIKMETKSVYVDIVRHETTGLMLAVARNLPGLMVPGRTAEEIERALPAAIRELLEATGREVIDVRYIEDGPLPEGFVSPPRGRVEAEMVPA